jgi:CubicO group peptidase (beta-lactamase class C family)
MKKIEMIIRPDRAELVKGVLDEVGAGGVTVTSVMGYGAQKGSLDKYRGTEVPNNLLHKIKIDVVAADEMVEQIVEKVSGMPQDEYLKNFLYTPLKMKDTDYTPDPSLIDRIVPTEYNNGELIHGYVHDENTHSLGGVAGHAGLFSSAPDLSVFCRMMLHEGTLNGVQIFKPETIKLFTTRLDETSSRCLGWDSPEGESSGGIYISAHSFGHTGYTGTSLWIDAENDVYVILLTNAVHPDRKYKYPNYFEWRQLLHSAAYEELGLTTRNPEVFLKKRWVKKFKIPRKI